MAWRSLSLILLAAVQMALAEDTNMLPAPAPGSTKTIEVEWETVPNAESYEVRLAPADGGNALVFTSKESKLSEVVPIGLYKLQIRSKGKDADEFSAWTPPADFEVAQKETFPLYPEDGSNIDARTVQKQTIQFKWTPVQKVKEYTLKVWNDEHKEAPWSFTVKDTTKRLDVPPGRTYYWQVLFQSADDVTYLQNPKTFSFTLQGTRLLKPEINQKQSSTALSWKAVAGAKSYKFKLYYRHLDEKDWTFVKEDTSDEPAWATEKLKTGAYKLEVIAEAPHRMSSEPASREFLIKPTADELSLLMRTAVR